MTEHWPPREIVQLCVLAELVGKAPRVTTIKTATRGRATAKDTARTFNLVEPLATFHAMIFYLSRCRSSLKSFPRNQA